jgi:hypothetical protein
MNVKRFIAFDMSDVGYTLGKIFYRIDYTPGLNPVFADGRIKP